MTAVENYNIRLATPADENQASTMAAICAEGRIRAYGIKPGNPDYELGVTQQLSPNGLEELRHQIRLSAAGESATRFWVAERRIDRTVAGICIAQMINTPPHVYLDRVFVAEADEGNGIASAFLERVIDWGDGRAIESEVVSGNERALGLYTRRGFVVAGTADPIPGFEGGLERLNIVRKAESKEANE